MKATPHEACALYLGLKLHFTGKYDFFKYGPRKITSTAFDTRRDKLHFYRLTSLYPREELRFFYISNLLVDPKMWIGEFNRDTYLDYQKIVGSFSYIFSQEINKLFNRYGYLDSCKCKPFETPPLIEAYYAGEISIQTVTAFDNLTNVFPMFDAHMSEDPIWVRTRLLIDKYRPFFHYDEKKIKKTLIDAMKSHK